MVDGPGLYAILVQDSFYAGETGIFAVRFNQHLSGVEGDNEKLAKAKTSAKKSSVPVQPLVLLPLPKSVPATVRHIFETILNVRTGATSEQNLNVNVFDSNFHKDKQIYSGPEIKAFLLAVKDHLAHGGKLPREQDHKWVDLFANNFENKPSPAFMSQLASGLVRRKAVKFYMEQIGLKIDDDVWEGRLRQAFGVKRQHPKARTAAAESSLAATFSTTDERAAFAARFGLGRASKKKKLR